MMICDLQGLVLKDNVASALLSFGTLVLGGSQCHIIRTLQQPFGETHGQGQDTSCQEPISTGQPCEGATLETPAPVKPSDECSHG